MKELGEIYWEIHHKWYEESLTLDEETTLLYQAAEEYVEELLKHEERWKSILIHDIEYLKASSFCRREVKGYSMGANLFLSLVRQKIKRYGLNIDDIENQENKSISDKLNPESDKNDTSNTDNGKGEKPKTRKEQLSSEAIIQSLEGKEVFRPLKPINLYGLYYDRLTKGTIEDEKGNTKKLEVIRKVCDDDKTNIDLFKRCVERADISSLYNTGKKCYAKLFMNDIASLFSEPEQFRKAAAKSFNPTNDTHLCNVGGDYKKDYKLLMKGLFDEESDWRKGKS